MSRCIVFDVNNIFNMCVFCQLKYHELDIPSAFFYPMSHWTYRREVNPFICHSLYTHILWPCQSALTIRLLMAVGACALLEKVIWVIGVAGPPNGCLILDISMSPHKAHRQPTVKPAQQSTAWHANSLNALCNRKKVCVCTAGTHTRSDRRGVICLLGVSVRSVWLGSLLSRLNSKRKDTQQKSQITHLWDTYTSSRDESEYKRNFILSIHSSNGRTWPWPNQSLGFDF